MRPLVSLTGMAIVAFVLCPSSAQPAESPDAEPAWKQMERTRVPTIYNQERRKSWDYQVVAVNKAAEGPPSNIVTAVL